MIRIGAVSFLNTKPFIYGIEQSGILNDFELILDVPSVCAQKMMLGEIDIGLVPVAILPKLKSYHVFSDYCIGSLGEVGSVMLFSQVDMRNIKRIILDSSSYTSNVLAKVLAIEYWKISPEWVDTKGSEERILIHNDGIVVIGDRSFSMNSQFKYQYDLSAEWYRFCRKPFVFACWVTSSTIDGAFLQDFNRALNFGIVNKKSAILPYLTEAGLDKKKISRNILNEISYSFSKDKYSALEYFLSLAERHNLNPS